MNLKDFLKAKKEILPVTEEVLFPVVVGVGTFTPFHMGYLPMLTKLMSESERFRCDAIVVVLESDQSDYAVSKLKEMAPNLKVMVRSDVNAALSDLSQHQRAPSVIYCDEISSASVKMVYEHMYPMSAIEVNTTAYLVNFENQIVDGLTEGNFLKFHASHIDAPLIESRTLFNTLRSKYGYHKSV